MNEYKFGDVVLIEFPLTNSREIKKRPALVLADSMDDDILVCKITGQLYDTNFDILVKEYTSIGLKIASVIRIHKLATLEKSLVSKKFGNLNENMKNNVSQKLKLLFKL
ncbi:MAG TPA: type II toxin-antitoxin system PemK/MazF family toxin [Ignavibacteria bacterium]|nr:type II toxin-antitoxin system PemK/MazF family toxin [Ignavibacteria bacterium]